MTNFAVIQTGGKEYKVEAGSKIKIEKIIGEYKVGDKLSFENVLLVIDRAKHKTVEVVKYMPKSRYFKRNGHRQPYFEIKVLAI